MNVRPLALAAALVAAAFTLAGCPADAGDHGRKPKASLTDCAPAGTASCTVVSKEYVKATGDYEVCVKMPDGQVCEAVPVDLYNGAHVGKPYTGAVG
ncbi:hypothetical protein [Actinoplanes sp. URMC 104]|uniref:hypothetical protein n=1 Tax=Actinoplanes sp. URMC 104 TaxID=3423409 RepID=UPI003F1C18E9